MILNSELGIVIDTISYGLVVNNLASVEAELKEKQFSDEDLVSCVEAVKQEVGEMPTWCKALFFVGGRRYPESEDFFLH